jgi:hypothetical protein
MGVEGVLRNYDAAKAAKKSSGEAKTEPLLQASK